MRIIIAKILNILDSEII